MAVGALECPYPVDEVIIGYGQSETDGISDVFVDFDFFFTQPGCAKIDRHAQQARQSKFYNAEE